MTSAVPSRLDLSLQ